MSEEEEEDGKQPARAHELNDLLDKKKSDVLLDSIDKNEAELMRLIDECTRHLDCLNLSTQQTEFITISKLQGKAELFVERLHKSKVTIATELHYRLVEVDFDSVELCPLSQTVDLEMFESRVKNLFQWHCDEKRQKMFNAPYFPLIQSSGMGKTKLFYELYQRIMKKNQGAKKKTEQQYHCELVLCNPDERQVDVKIGEDENAFYSYMLLVETTEPEKTESLQRFLPRIETLLTKAVACNKKKVIRLFDEAQHLLLHDAYWF